MSTWLLLAITIIVSSYRYDDVGSSWLLQLFLWFDTFFFFYLSLELFSSSSFVRPLLLSINQVLPSRLYIYEVIIQGLYPISIIFSPSLLLLCGRLAGWIKPSEMRVSACTQQLLVAVGNTRGYGLNKRRTKKKMHLEPKWCGIESSLSDWALAALGF